MQRAGIPIIDDARLAVEVIGDNHFDLYFSDLSMPGFGGRQLLRNNMDSKTPRQSGASKIALLFSRQSETFASHHHNVTTKPYHIEKTKHSVPPLVEVGHEGNSFFLHLLYHSFCQKIF